MDRRVYKSQVGPLIGTSLYGSVVERRTCTSYRVMRRSIVRSCVEARFFLGRVPKCKARPARATDTHCISSAVQRRMHALSTRCLASPLKVSLMLDWTGSAGK